MSRIGERLESLGYRVFMVPETPTMLFQGGFSLHDVTPAQIVALETVLLQTVMHTEDSFREIAKVYGDDCVFLCDRGMMDTKAYVSSEMWSTILNNLGQTEVQLRDQRYEAVIHMVTAADGAEEHYTLANNTARTETPEQARDLDKKTQDAWIGHPHLRVVGNSSDFDDKVREAGVHACNVVGVPVPQEDERKFLVSFVGDIPVKNVTVEIVQHYLVNDDPKVEERVRKRGRDGSFVYTHTMKRRLGPGSAAELDRMITPADHLMALERRDPDCAPVYKTRTCFVWEGKYWELDRYTTWTPDREGGHLTVLEVEVEDLEAPLNLPPFLKIEREVTGEKAFQNREIARSLMGHDSQKFLERLREEGTIAIPMPDSRVADDLVDALEDLYDHATEDIQSSVLGCEPLPLPYVVTFTHVSVHD